MRTLVAAILSVFVIAAGLGSKPAQAQNGVVTFKFTNKASYVIYLKMYSQNRNHVWPGASTHYILDDEEEHVSRLACNVGEKICYGGAYTTDGSGVYWGVGYMNDHSCRGCCLVCGTPAQNVSHSWNLLD